MTRAPLDQASQINASSSALDFLADGSDMGERIRTLDWSGTPLGPAEGWSPSLRMVVRLMLANRFPMILWWGPEFIQFYNDAYIPIPGHKHPRALGQPAAECWSEIWSVIGPLIETPFQGGPATWMEDIYLEIQRRGFVEETHFTIAYSPVPDDTVPGGIGGVLATVHEITGKVVGDRRVLILRDLGARASEARTAEDACTMAAETLAQHGKDLPFALLYLIDPDRQQARLTGSAGVGTGEAASPAVIPLEDGSTDRSPWPLRAVQRREASEAVTGLAEVLGDAVPSGPWADPPHTAVVVPIRSNKAHVLAGFLVAGISARLQLDEAYRDFLELVASQIATAIANAREYEEEKKRAEALAEIDRAKTLFFSNVSHEFRTPLTLLLGPTEDALASAEPALRGEDLASVHRNALRLLKLTNTLLDFSRIEAGRIEASYEPVDLAALTADLASVFRSAIEKAGLRLAVDCPPLPEPVYVDREMWEKIVLNLLSNAFKFTFEGEIAVALRWQGDHVELAVRDTGTGIPPEQLPQLFERFHRVPNARSRTHEGTGIGLALVKELVRYHGGSIAVESAVDRGTIFTVNLPTGCTHLPSERLRAGKMLASTALGARPYVEEALRWLPEVEGHQEAALGSGAVSDRGVPANAPNPDGDPARVLVADDNADLRHYLRQLLSPHWRVEAVADGAAALEAARREPPDLVLADIMMPGLDGFELLQQLRANPATREIPVILLSARAGEEARVEGLAAGADDYLVKPFSAHELVARVGNQLDLARVRREAAQTLRESEERYRTLMTASSEAIYRMSPDWTQMNQLEGRGFLAHTAEPSDSWLDRYILPEDQPQVTAAIREALRTKQVFELEHRVLRADGSVGWTFSRAVPRLNARGEIVEWFGAASDITARKQAEESTERLLALMDHNPSLVFLKDEQGHYVYLNRAYEKQFVGSTDWLGKTDFDFWPKPSAELFRSNDAAVLEAGEVRQFLEDSTDRVGRRYCWLCYKFPFIDSQNRGYLGGIGIDVTDRVQAEEALAESAEKLRAADRQKDEFLATLAHELRNPLAPIRTALQVFRKTVAPNPRTDRLLTLMDRQMTHLVRLVDDLLEVSRITRGKIELRKESIELATIMGHALDTSRPLIDAGQHGLEVSLPPEPLPIEADPVRLTQVFANLLNNAAKYTEPGGIIRVVAKRDGNEAVVSVRDTGVGIPAELLPRVFELFTQADRSMGRAQGGLGIGLALVRHLVDMHGGTAIARSDGPGRGSEFVVRLPMFAEPSTVQTRSDRTEGSTPITTHRILVVDDNRDAAESLGELLTLEGHETRLAHDGEEGLQMAESFRPEVILLDLGMPRVDGYEACRHLREQPWGRGMTVVALTGWGQEEDRRKAREAGFDAHLVKPVDYEALTELIAGLPRTGDSRPPGVETGL